MVVRERKMPVTLCNLKKMNVTARKRDEEKKDDGGNLSHL